MAYEVLQIRWFFCNGCSFAFACVARVLNQSTQRVRTIASA